MAGVVLRRERLILGAGLGLLTILAWVYLLSGAGMGMSVAEMTRLTLLPHRTGEAVSDISGMPWSFATAAVVLLMWWIMMAAMMTPGAAPFVMLYEQVRNRAERTGQGSALASPGLLVAGYLAAWLCFSVVATSLHWLLQQRGLISGTAWSQSRWLSAAVLAAAGAYQFTPLKHACLSHCRAPVQFMSRHWRPGRTGALMMGLVHGGYCVGCCWALMALLFVGGVMNVAWIAVLALLVLGEKLSPAGQALGRLTGVLLLAWSLATLLV